MNIPDDFEILLIEDNPTDAELIVRAMKKNDVHQNYLHIRDGEEALDFIYCKGVFSDRRPQNLPKVVFLDLKLPKVDGHEVLRTMKNEALIMDVPVVVFSSSGEETDIVKSYEAGANSYVVKPVDIDKFFDTLCTVITYWLEINYPQSE